jgi:chromosome segregation ATPase
LRFYIYGDKYEWIANLGKLGFAQYFHRGTKFRVSIFFSAESVTDYNQEKENIINNLQDQISKFNQQKSELHSRIRELSSSLQRKISELEELQNQKSRLNAKKSEWEQKYQTLYQNYQQQNDEIASLKVQLAQAKLSQTSNYSYPQQVQPNTKQIATKNKISLEEYRRIYNQSDYIYVNSYYRKNGTYVKAHYRRRPNG